MPQRLKRRSEAELEDSPPPTRARRDEDDEDDEDDEEVTEGEDDASPANGAPPIEQLVKKLVRLALSTEFTRQPLRRADITTKVLESHGRFFKQVFRGAQEALRNTFGMQLIELPSREKVTVAQKRAAQRTGQSQSQSSSTTKSYILTTMLPVHLRIPAVLPPGRNPTSAQEAEYIGLYTFVVSLIYMSQGQRLAEGKLERYLHQLNAGEYAMKDQKTDDVLKRMEKQGYIVKVRDREAGGEETIDWILGPRGKIEVGEKGAAGLIRSVYVKKDAELEMLEDKMERSLGKGTFKRFTKKGGKTQEDGDAGEEDDAETPAAGPSRSRGRRQTSSDPATPAPPRRSRRSNIIDDEAQGEDDEEEDDNEEEEEEEEEDNDDEEEEDEDEEDED